MINTGLRLMAIPMFLFASIYMQIHSRQMYAPIILQSHFEFSCFFAIFAVEKEMTD